MRGERNRSEWNEEIQGFEMSFWLLWGGKLGDTCGEGVNGRGRGGDGSKVKAERGKTSESFEIRGKEGNGEAEGKRGEGF